MRASTIFVIAGIALATLLGAPTLFKTKSTQEPSPILAAFKGWMVKHNKLYATPQEHLYRFGVFLKTLRNIEQIASDKSLTYTVGLNQFSDLTEEEFLAKYTGYTPSTENREVVEDPRPRTQITNDNVDWRKVGAVTPIKNQGNCASAYAFSVVAAIESVWKIAGNPLDPFSEQQVIDCSNSFGNNGCSGGLMTNAFRYLTRGVKGIESSSDYPYFGIQKPCFYQENKVKGIIRSYATIAANDCNSLLHALTNHPVSVAIAANAIQFYTSGIFNNPRCGTQLNHAVTAIGYGLDPNTKSEYWLVRNSWGISWGEAGYIRFIRDDNKSEPGMCGICMDTSFPIA